VAIHCIAAVWRAYYDLVESGKQHLPKKHVSKLL
jgi:hypothetical protein